LLLRLVEYQPAEATVERGDGLRRLLVDGLSKFGMPQDLDVRNGWPGRNRLEAFPVPLRRPSANRTQCK